MRHRRPLPAIREVPIQGVSGWGGRPARNGILPRDGLIRWRVWNTFAWPGAGGVAIADALGGDGDLANDISAAVAALYGWDEEAGAWLAFFPTLGDVPGGNTLATQEQGGAYVSYILGAPEFVNRQFAELYTEAVPAATPLTVRSDGPATADPVPGVAVAEPWPECLRGDIVAGFSLVLYQGGSVADLDACAGTLDVSALYVLHGRAWVSYILGAPDFVNSEFRELFADGLSPSMHARGRWTSRPCTSCTVARGSPTSSGRRTS